METRSKRKRFEPLPGDRRGTSGADAGCDSLRAVGGEELTRRALSGKPETATAENQPDSTTPHPPVGSASPPTTVPDLGTTKTGKPRQRMRWTLEMNSAVMHSYYRITNLETNLTAYRSKLHKEFVDKYPDLKHVVSEQRIADQVNAIKRRNLIPKTTLEQIKQIIARQLSTEKDYTSTESVQNTTEDSNNEQACNEAVSEEVQHISQAPDPELMNLFNELLIKYQGLDPTCRPSIPRMNTSKRLFTIVDNLNTTVIPQHITEAEDISAIHTLIYIGALTTSIAMGYNIPAEREESKQKRKNNNCNKPAWRKRLEKDIENLRKDIARLSQYQNNNRCKNLMNHVTAIFQQIGTNPSEDAHQNKIAEHINFLKQKLAVKSHRLARYQKSNLRKKHNRIFRRNEKYFYRLLQNPHETTETTKLPTAQTLQAYWESVWSNPVNHKEDAAWITEEEALRNHITPMELAEITTEELTRTIAQTQNWKSPGLDKVQNFWIKKFTCTHGRLTEVINQLLKNPSEIPSFLTGGVTYMKAKSTNTEDPSQYRPITCLPTLYKIITSCVTNRIYQHVEGNHILAEQQKGCRRSHMGCKEQLIIDKIVLEQAHQRKRNLHIGYIDYKKAFDSVPHSWLIHILQIYKVHPQVINFLHTMMTSWRTILQVTNSREVITTDEIPIRRGIFQGDSLSPLWFCLALNPLSTCLNSTNYGYQIKHRKITNAILSHLLYMDDLKLYASTEQQLHNLLRITESFSTDIQMNFGLDKCRVLHIEKGHVLPGDHELQDHPCQTIQSMEPEDTYKYLGMLQNQRLQRTAIKTNISNAYKKRLNTILKSHLTSKNMFKAINTFAVPTLTYSFGIIDWSDTDLDTLMRYTRTMLTRQRLHHPKAAIERLTLPRKEGGRGLIHLKALHNRQVNNLRNFFHTKATESQLHAAIVQADAKYTPLNLLDKSNNRSVTTTEECLTAWSRKELHGRHWHDLHQEHVDKELSNKWLEAGQLYGETEGFMVAIQDQTVPTKNHLKYIIKDPAITDDRCRRCHLAPETIQHITSGCQLLANTAYLHRHNLVANIIHRQLAIQHNMIDNPEPYYNYKPPSVVETNTHVLYYDKTIHTDKTIPYNRPDIVLVNKSDSSTVLVDVAVPNTHNLQHTISEKINKYKDLAIEIKRIWNMKKVTVVPFVISNTGVTPKQIRSSLNFLNLPIHITYQIQKAIILETCHIVRDFLNTEIRDSIITVTET